jgi:hypothetical protein
LPAGFSGRLDPFRFLSGDLAERRVRPYFGPMHDPRTPEILAWLESLSLRERLTTLHAMSFAFPLLKNDRGWNVRISAVLVELGPTKREHEDILMEAARMSARLKKAQLAG